MTHNTEDQEALSRRRRQRSVFARNRRDATILAQPADPTPQQPTVGRTGDVGQSALTPAGANIAANDAAGVRFKDLLKDPRLPRYIRARRTRHINKDTNVVNRRKAVEAALADTYADAARARKSLERLMDQGQSPTSLTETLFARPAAFGDWLGATYTSVRHVPKADFADLLGRLHAALHAARTAAKIVHPASAPSLERHSGRNTP